MTETPQTRAFYIRQATFIGIGIVVATSAMIYALEYGGSAWWLLIAYLAAAIPSGPMMLRVLEPIGALIGVQDGPLVIVGFAVLLFLLPVLASVFLVAAFVQAVRHR